MLRKTAIATLTTTGRLRRGHSSPRRCSTTPTTTTTLTTTTNATGAFPRLLSAWDGGPPPPPPFPQSHRERWLVCLVEVRGIRRRETSLLDGAKEEATTTTTTTSKSGNKRGDVENDDDDALFFEHVRLNRDIVACTTHGQIGRTRGTALGKIQRRERLHRLAPAGEKTRTRRAKSVHQAATARVLLLEEATVRCMRGLFQEQRRTKSRTRLAETQREATIDGESSTKRRMLSTLKTSGISCGRSATMLYTPRLEILDKFADIIEENVDKLYPQALSNSLWSFARLKRVEFF